MSFSRTNIILSIIGLAILAAAGYLLFGQNHDAGVVASGGPASAAEVTFIGLTAQIDPVVFDTSILQDPRFAGLRDIKTAVTPEVAGRFDPFAPLGR